MTHAACRLVALVLAMSAVGCDAAPAAAPAPLRLGVTVHFAQGWPERLWQAIAAVHAGTVREALGWRKIEAVRGTYGFTAANSGHIARLCAMKVPVVVVIDPRNPLYDNGETANSDQAQAAFGAFVAAVGDRFGSCLAAIEVGNEINGARAMTGAAASGRAASHTRLMKSVWQTAKPRHLDIMILGGSVNTVGTGFLERLFAQGLLDWVDGIAIHPYRRTPEGLDWELAGLREAMARHGGAKPVWVTEFGVEASDAVPAADYLLTTALLLSASGAREAQWYALADDAAFPSMGLVRADGATKPAAAAFWMLTTDLLQRGPAIRLSSDEPALHRYRLGADREVVWGAPRAITLPAGAIVRSSTGERLTGAVRIGPSPIVIESAQPAQPGPSEVLADSLYDYARPVWSYSGAGQAAQSSRLRAVHGNFATTLGAESLGPLAVNPLGMILPAQATPVSMTMRHAVLAPARIVAQACLSRKAQSTGTAEFSLSTGDHTGHTQPVPPEGLSVSREIDASAGDTINFVTSARGGAAVVAYRFRILVAGTPAARELMRCS